MTKKEMFANIKTLLADNAEVVEFCDKQIEVLSRKRSTSKPTKTQIANEGVKAEIAEVLANADAPMTVTAIVKALDNAYTSQKVSALLRQMDNVNRISEKKVSYFEIA